MHAAVLQCTPHLLVHQPPLTAHHTQHRTGVTLVAWVSGRLQPGEGRGGIGKYTKQHAWAAMQHYVTNTNLLAYVHNKNVCTYVLMHESEEPKHIK